MPKYKYEGKFECSDCGKKSIKKGTCRPKVCPICNANKSALKLISKKELNN